MAAVAVASTSNPPALEPPTTLKLLVIGASSVGKSSLLLRFTDELFLGPEETSATIGVDFRVKVVDKRGKRWKLSIWDTAGMERFRVLTSSYYRGAQGVILVYDITARDTFDSLSSWIAELDTFAGASPSSRDVVRMIVGNKVDKEYSRAVTTAEGAAFAASRDPPWEFMECSAKQGGAGVVGAEGLFSRVVDHILDKPQLYDKSLMPRVGPPGTYPRKAGSITLDDDMAGSSWCSC